MLKVKQSKAVSRYSHFPALLKGKETKMVHQYKLGGYNVVLDICSGAVHVVDDIAYDIIELYLNKSREEIIEEIYAKYQEAEEVSREDVAECYDQISELKESGKLFCPDNYEPMADQLKAKTAGVVKALCLHIAHTCNLNCSYCFASQGKYHGERAVMSYEVGKRALDFLVEIHLIAPPILTDRYARG